MNSKEEVIKILNKFFGELAPAINLTFFDNEYMRYIATRRLLPEFSPVLKLDKVSNLYFPCALIRSNERHITPFLTKEERERVRERDRELAKERELEDLIPYPTFKNRTTSL